ncbi:MAG: ferrous iron transport protein B [Thermoplasmatota archaeon]
MAKKDLRIALAGNPNVGKTSLFNRLTRSNQKVGNWPGVTVEKLSGSRTYKGRKLQVVDLPGTYSLNGCSQDELIARDFIIRERPDVVVHVVDSNNLERNLYLTLQLLELGSPLVMALNKVDVLRRRGDKLDSPKLAGILNVTVVETVSTSGEGVEDLMESIVAGDHEWTEAPSIVDYGRQIEQRIEGIAEILKDSREVLGPYPKRWLSTRLVEGDEELLSRSTESHLWKRIENALEGLDHEAVELEMADMRYDMASSITRGVLKSRPRERTLTNMLDEVVTNKYTGIPIFLVIMWGMFELTFTLGEPLSELIDIGFGRLGDLAVDNLSPSWLASLVGEGVIGGVGAVLVFLPNIMILFLVISVLEGSGYMSRVAFVMDRLMTRIGLSGKSFIPMIIGFGCNVPAIMSARTIEDRKDRLVTILVNPFISCGARLPVYIMLTGIFFPSMGGTVIFALYILGIITAIGTAKLFRMTILKGSPAPLIMELPDYEPPSMKEALRYTWEKGYLYARKAGTVILLGSVLMWGLANYSFGMAPVDYGSRESIAGQLGVVISPLLSPLGFDWKIGVALIFGFFAKEIVIGSLGVLYNVDGGEKALTERISSDPNFTALSSMGLMVFVLLYMPCIATVGAIKQETGSWGWTIFAVLYGTALAWIAAFLVYQGGVLLGFG